MMKNHAMVTVEFKSLPNFRCLLTEWREIGGYKGFLKEYHISISAIKSVKTEILNANQYPTQPWEDNPTPPPDAGDFKKGKDPE
jgi:hypothetical protein